MNLNGGRKMLKYCLKPYFIIFSLMLLLVPISGMQYFKPFFKKWVLAGNFPKPEPFYPTARGDWDSAQLKRKFPFLNLQANQITYPGDSTALDYFYQKLFLLNTFNQGKLNVLHIGGSHVQAGFLGERMRTNMMLLTNGRLGEKGFFFPFQLANQHGPFNVEVRSSGKWRLCRSVLQSANCNWGLSGVQAYNGDSLIEMVVKAPSPLDSVAHYEFNTAYIYFNPDSAAYDIVVLNPEWQKQELDSAAGYVKITFTKPVDSLHFVAKRVRLSHPFELQGFKFEQTGLPGFTYTEVGANGASTASYLRCGRFVPQLATTPPDLVVFGIGINDAHKSPIDFNEDEFKENYVQLMHRFRFVNPRVSFLFISNNDSYFTKKSPNKNIHKVRKVMQELCAEEKAAFWDFYTIMGGWNSIKKWHMAGLAKKDKIHLTRDGYRLQADMLFEALRKDYIRHHALETAGK
jgi:lysophospholipase L1-like esterase